MVGFRETSLSLTGQLPNFQGRTQAGTDQEATSRWLLALTVDHVKVKNKVVVDMAETLAWHAFCVAGAPNVVGPMTLALVSTSTPPLPSSRSLVLRQQLVTPSLCGMTTLVNPMQFAAATGGGANIATIADPLIAAEVVSSGKFAVLKIGFSALHRALLEGHSGFTAAAQKRGTVSYKCAAVAGQDKEAFLEFLDK